MAGTLTRTDIASASLHFVEFLVWPRNGNMTQAVHVPITLRQPIKLYDEAVGSPYRKARARAWKVARQRLELSPSMPMHAEPHDWSDSVDALCAGEAA